jgi:hypothetical protein
LTELVSTGKATGSATEADIDISYTTPEGTTFQLSSVRSGVAEEVWLETKWMDLGSPYWKFIDYVIIKITGITKGDFSVQVAVVDEADEYTNLPGKVHLSSGRWRVRCSSRDRYRSQWAGISSSAFAMRMFAGVGR